MTPRSRSRTLKEIVHVRKVQERAAQMAVGRANADLEGLEQARNQADDQLAQDQMNWAAATSGGRLDPAVSGAWSAAVLRAQDDVREIDARIEDAKTLKAQRSDEWRTSLGRADLASGLARKARRALDRADEESALAEVADRIAQKGSLP